MLSMTTTTTFGRIAPGRTHLPLYAAGRSLRHGRVIRRELPGQKRRRFRIRQRPVIGAVIQFILEKGAEQAVKAILGHFRIITVVHGIRILDIHQPISPVTQASRNSTTQPRFHPAGTAPFLGSRNFFIPQAARTDTARMPPRIGMMG